LIWRKYTFNNVFLNPLHQLYNAEIYSNKKFKKCLEKPINAFDIYIYIYIYMYNIIYLYKTMIYYVRSVFIQETQERLLSKGYVLYVFVYP
jgi:hypothetical protein